MPRRPGISFESVTPSVPEVLPRMDVAGFVGFASRGPIDVPVPIEGMERFRDVFGPPLELVRDPASRQMKTAHLDRAVETFFRNGGQRCWVVRVAHHPDDSSSGPVERAAFCLPGVIGAAAGQPRHVRARSYGASFDDMRVGSVHRRRLLPEPAKAERTDSSSRALRLTWTRDSGHPMEETRLREGDLLRLDFKEDESNPDAGNLYAFAAVDSTSLANARNNRRWRADSLDVTTGRAYLFERAPSPLHTIGGSMRVDVERLQVDGMADRLPNDPSRTLAVRRSHDTGGRPAFRLTITHERTGGSENSSPASDPKDAEAVTASDLEQEFVHVHQTDGDVTGWMQLGRVVARGDSENGDAFVEEVRVRAVLWPADVEDAFGDAQLPPVQTVERNRFDLLTWDGQELQQRFEDLGFASAHPRSWTSLPTDDELFALEGGEVAPLEPGTLQAEVFNPRFPLAGPDVPDEAGPFIPLAMADRPDPERTGGRIISEGEPSRLERELLETFSTDIFVDSELAGISTASLADRADEMIFVEQESASGIHSLWPVREVTLLAAPDAVHYGWDEPEGVTPEPSSTPVLKEPVVHRETDPPYVRLTWEVDRLEESDVVVELHEASQPDFSDAVVRYRGSDAAVERYVRSDDPEILYFRYRIIESEQPGAWSNTRQAAVPAQDFERCVNRPDTPRLVGPVDNRLYWAFPDEMSSSGLTHEIQIDDTPTLDRPKVLKQTLEEEAGPPDMSAGAMPPDPDEYDWYHVSVPSGGAPVRYVRIRGRRSVDGNTLIGGWSNAAAVVRPVRGEMAITSPEEYDNGSIGMPVSGRQALLELQRAMLRLGAARGDIVSLLTLPRHDQPQDAERHAAQLRTPGGLLDYGEERTLSYGALYYPWLLPDAEDGRPDAPIPPGGSAAGMIARRTLRDGAWMAPANKPLAAARTVVPPLDASGQRTLHASPINVFAETPGGVLTLDTSTLANDPELEPLTTRRLLILVRRLVERDGPALVFENHTPLLRRRIAEQLDDVLGRLFERGAFAGSTASEGYRVIADASVNPRQQVEQGRLIVELRIAPSRPLKFLTVRLVQRSGQRPMLTEATTGATA